MGNKISATTVDYNIAHAPPSKLLVDCIPANKAQNLDFKPNIEEHIDNVVTCASNGAQFPLQVEQSQSGIYNMMLLRELPTNLVKILIIQDKTYDKEATFFIFTGNPNYEGQCPITTDIYTRGHLYEYAKIQEHHSLRGTSYNLWKRENSPTMTPAFIARPASPILPTHHHLNVVKGGTNEACASINGKYAADQKDDCWNIQIAKGIDPALMISFVAVINSIVITHWKERIEACEQF